MMKDPIPIIGAGVSGLALAQGLLSNNVPFRIFERDPELHTRSQGYRFRVSEEGIEALTQNLPPKKLAKLEACCCAEVRSDTGNVPQIHLDATTAEKSGWLYKSGQQGPIRATGKPWSADRGALRYVRSSGLGSLLEYGKELDKHEDGEDSVTVTFKDGSTARGCLLVGADGVWSKIRSQLLPSYALVDTKGRLIYGKTEVTSDFIAKFSPEAMNGLTFIRDSKREFSCLLEPMRFNTNERDSPSDYVYWVLFFRNVR